MAPRLWPYEQAEAVLQRFGKASRILFETGYGPSGLPHIGTFCEVARTSWIRQALAELRPDLPSEIYAFSDDMDGLRKVPLSFVGEPRRMLEANLGKPLCDIPDPFGCCTSYADHNNGELRKMLDRYGFSYTFRSSREQYRGGGFNDGLRAILAHVEAIRGLILPTLSPEKREGWSPFIPICTACGRLYSTTVTGYLPDRDAITYRCDRPVGGEPGCGADGEISVLDGHVKVGWKVDWALRWFVFGVHYEMYGKDLIESADLSRKIVRMLGGKPPVHYFYEMFLDESGAKISKSVGKGITVESWLRYAPQESLALFLFRNPRKARRLSWDGLARSVDEYLDLLDTRYDGEGDERAPELRFIHPELPAEHPYRYRVSYSMLLNLVAAVGGEDPDVVARYVHEYRGEHPGSEAFLRELIDDAMAFHREIRLPAAPEVRFDDRERELLAATARMLETAADEEAVQTGAFDVARGLDIPAREGFRVLYRALCGQDHGPRFGPFVMLVGRDRVRESLERAAAAPATGG
ncbi:MAG: lysine--tRNA ligase [Acidobacteriota bacterium]